MSNERTFEDAFDLLCGELLGYGIHRKVYECRLLPDCVVKVEVHDKRDRWFGNVHESKFWDEYGHLPKIGGWLAPVHFLSPDGRILIQRRARIALPGDKLPEHLPHFLCDRKPANYGWIGKRFVCVDYALQINNPNTRMTRAKWRLD